MTIPRSILILLILPVVILSGCVTAEYAGPTNLGLPEEKISRVYNADFETVWTAIRTHSKLFFFTITDLDKESGSVSADFTGNPVIYVDGGQFTRSGAKSSEGYTSYLRQKNLKLSGTLNLNITEIDQGRTRVTVLAQYTVSLSGKPYVNSFTGETVAGTQTIWSFESTGHDTQNPSSTSERTSNPARTFSPTGALESQVLEDLEDVIL